MPGKKISELEIERLLITDDGRGLIVYDDATNFKTAATSPWGGGVVSSSVLLDTRTLLPTASSMGWLKIHYISGSTYGATGAACYIPVFKNLNLTG